MPDMNDAARAKAKANFGLTKDDLINVIECYRQRKYVEDLEYIKDKLNGIEGVLTALDVNPDEGTSSSSSATTTLENRKLVFGDHKKDMPTRSSFFELIWESLQDLMLQVLIVCAIFSLVVDMSFAEGHEKAHAWIEGAAILIAVAVVSLVTAVSDYKKEGQFLKQL